MPACLTCAGVNVVLVRVFDSGQHSLFVEASGSMQIPYVNFYFSLRVDIFGNDFEIVPVHKAF